MIDLIWDNVCRKTIFLQPGKWYYDAFNDICPANADRANIRWSSSNTNIAVVDVLCGYIHAKTEGTVEICARTLDGDNEAYITVIVDAKKHIESIQLKMNNLVLFEGESCFLTVELSPREITDRRLLWSSSDSSVVAVENGKIIAVAPGAAFITVNTKDGSEKAAQCFVNVIEKIFVTTITINPDSIEMEVGEKIHIFAEIIPQNASNKSIAWYTNNSDVISVNRKGLVCAKSKGKAKVYAMAQDGSDIAESCEIIVK